VESIVWQTEIILKNNAQKQTLVAINPFSVDSVSEIFIYTEDRPHLFATLTASINQQGLSIQAANIVTTKNNYCYDSFFVLDDSGNALDNKVTINTIIQNIKRHLKQPDNFELTVQRRLPRQFKYFTVPTKVTFSDDDYSGFTRLELSTRDQAGLLACIGLAFKTTQIKLHDARVNTLGEKVEDTFIISDYNNQPINNTKKRHEIRDEIIRQLDN
jgi:[protein-PII] uridylyltransferase